jgi:hypothetical protein
MRPNENEVFELSGRFVDIDIGTVILNSDTPIYINNEK